MSRESACEICGRPGSSDGYRYSRHGSHMGEIALGAMKRCWSCKKLGCGDCLVAVEEIADDHFIEFFSCSDCLAK